MSWFVVSNTTFSSISKLFQKNIFSKPLPTSGISKSCRAICVKLDVLNFLWFLYEINRPSLILYVEFNSVNFSFCQNCQCDNKISIIRHFKFYQWQSMFCFFGRSTDNLDLCMHVVILLWLSNYCSKTTVGFLSCFLKVKVFHFSVNCSLVWILTIVCFF